MPEVQNAELLTRIFGYWPTFHDAEVLAIFFDREGRDGYYGPTLETKIHVFEMTSEIDDQGRYVLRHHTLVTLRFFQVDTFQADGFNHQNVLGELEINALDPSEKENARFRVCFSTSYGLEMEFHCKAIQVAAVEPFRPTQMEHLTFGRWQLAFDREGTKRGKHAERRAGGMRLLILS
jgi:hypothetical protein